MKMRPLRLAAGAGALAAGTAAGSAALLAPEAAAETTPAPPSAPLTLTDTVSADLYGAPVTFTLTIANPSATVGATHVQLSDVLPAGVTYQPPPPPPPPPSTSTTSSTTSTSSTTAPAAPPPYVPPAPTVTAGPSGTTTLHWTGLEDIPAGGKLSVSFSAQAATAPAPNPASTPATATSATVSPAYLPGSVFSDQATLTADAGSPESATASAAVTVSTISLSQSTTPLPAGRVSGPVTDTIHLQGAPDSETDNIGVDLYLPPSVSLGICPAPPIPCSQPSVISDLNASAAADGTPNWPLSSGNTKFVDLHWSIAALAAGAHLDIAVPLNVTNPTSATAQTPIVLAVLTATAPVVAPGSSLPQARSALAVGTLPPPPVTTTTSVEPVKSPARPSGDRVTVHKALPTPVATPPAPALTANLAGSARAVVGPAQKVSEAVVSSGSDPSPFATPATGGAAPTPSSAPSSGSLPASVSAGRDPFVGPGQTEVVSTPAAQTVGVGSAVTKTISSSPQATSTSGLAYTGLDSTELASLAAGLLLAGGALVFSTRRRPAVPQHRIRR